MSSQVHSSFNRTGLSAISTERPFHYKVAFT
jgi:hypothetical protein